MWRQTVQADDVQVAYLETEKIYSEQAIEINNFIENYIHTSYSPILLLKGFEPKS